MKNKPVQDRIWEWAKAFVFAGIIVLLLRFFIFIPLQVEGDSMAPTLQADSYIAYENISAISRFDIIIFTSDDNQTYIKRVIGLPGETISYQNNQLYIDGEPVDEEFYYGNLKGEFIYTSDFTLEDLTGDKTVPAHSFFVLGDNRARSNDSRMFGFIDEENVIGKAFVTYYPLTKARILW